MAFPHQFRDEHIPALRKLCEGLGTAVAYGNRDFLAARETAKDEARRRGAELLPRNLQVELRDWIDLTIDKAASRRRPEVDAFNGVLDRTFDANERWMAEFMAKASPS